MAIGKGINCKFCPDYKLNCDGEATDCLCYVCPRNLGQCMCVKYCRETESVLYFENSTKSSSQENYKDLYED